MQQVIIVIHLMLVLAMIGVVLLQRSEGGGLGIGSSGGVMTSRGTANVLTRATAILAAGVFITSLAPSSIAGPGRGPPSTPPATRGGAGAPTPLGGGPPRRPPPPPAPAAPAAPSGPQVPQ